MKGKKRISAAFIIFTAFLAAVMFVPVTAQAGSLEPTGAPAPTMKTLDQIPPTWSLRISGPERFKVLQYTTIDPPSTIVIHQWGALDHETGLVWELAPSTDEFTWIDAMKHCFSLKRGDRGGWHLPTAEQMTSIFDHTGNPPPPILHMTEGHPFSFACCNDYWTSTRWGAANDAFTVSPFYGNVSTQADQEDYENVNINAADLPPESQHHAWCVRGGVGSELGY